MLLYDVYYYGRAYDRCIPLPKPDPKIRYAECQNGKREILIVRGGKWISCPDWPALPADKQD